MERSCFGSMYEENPEQKELIENQKFKFKSKTRGTRKFEGTSNIVATTTVTTETGPLQKRGNKKPGVFING